MQKPSKEADRILTILELAALRTRDKHKFMASLTPAENWWDTFAKEIATLAGEWRKYGGIEDIDA